MSEDTETIKDILDKLAQKSFLTAHSPGYTKLDGRTYSKHTEEALKSIEKIIERDVLGETSGSDMNDDELVTALRNMYRWGISTGRKLESGKIKRVDEREWEMIGSRLDQFEQTFTNRKIRRSKRALTNALYGKGEQ